MSWLGRIFRPAGRGEDLVLLKLRATRFRQLLRGCGAFLALLEDSAEKQGGGFILDRQYVVSLAEQVAEISDGVAFDLNALTAHRNLSFYEVVDRLRGELRTLLAEGGAEERTTSGGEAAPAVSPARLAAALARSRVVHRDRGQVACRGVAAGRVCNLAEGPLPEQLPAGCVLVAEDLPSGHEALRALNRAAAILLDKGGAADPAARRARELQIPAIVGLGNSTERLPGGSEVTVDADENVVYEGRVGELLDYDLAMRAGSGEEPEYALLRSLRRAAFSLTLPAGLAEPTLRDCRTFHDLVHLARSLAGNEMADLLSTRCRRVGAEVPLAGEPECKVRVVRLEHPSRHGRRDESRQADPASRPLAALLEGLAGPESLAAGASGALPGGVDAVATEEHVLAAMPLARGFDLFDATVSAAADLNSVYGRFSAGGEADAGGSRGALAGEVLSRLGFAVARTGREVSGWLRGLPGPETEERIRALGRLRTRLARPGVTRGEDRSAGPEADALSGTGS